MNSPYVGETRFLLRSALVLFVITVVIGILNGIDLVDFNRQQLLTHVHVGTIGWITMGVIAAAYTIFSLDDPPTSRAPYMRAIAIAAYALAFLTTTNALRPIVGTSVMITIVFAFGWAVARARTRTLSTSRSSRPSPRRYWAPCSACCSERVSRGHPVFLLS